MKIVSFKGQEYLFGGDSLDEGGFVATREQYETGECSFAHWFPDRGLLRYCEKIGSREDLAIIGDTDAVCGGDNFLGALKNIVSHPSWDGPLSD